MWNFKQGIHSSSRERGIQAKIWGCENFNIGIEMLAKMCQYHLAVTRERKAKGNLVIFTQFNLQF